MKLLKKALLYDIANMAYLIADTGTDSIHSLHRVRDICEEGNIDRVSRILGLAYAEILNVLKPVIVSLPCPEDTDHWKTPRNYPVEFRNDGEFRYLLSPEVKLKIKETAHEYMVCMVLADWLGVTFPEAADVWKFRFETALESLKDLVSSIERSLCVRTFRRRLNPW